jgi:tetratricopeptide (TPR) repeat protein
MAQAASGLMGAAILSYRQALLLQPDHVLSLNNLADALRTVGYPAEAAVLGRRCLTLRQDLGESWYNLGTSLQVLAKPDQAAPCHRRAIILKPSLSGAYHNLNTVLSQLGGPADHQLPVERAISLAPHDPIHYFALASTKRFAPGERHVAAMQALERQSDRLKPDDRVHLHFALAKAYGDIDEHERAFAQLLIANRLKRTLQPYDETIPLSLFARLQQVFTPELMAARSQGRQHPDGPLFILGMPRSGSSLVEQILASHADVAGAGEINLLGRITVDQMNGFPDALADLSDHDLRRLGRTYRERLEEIGGGKRWITNKLPENFVFCGLIHLALPSARIIHTRRDPIDTCLSCFGQNFVYGQPFSYDLGELGRYYRSYDRLMRHWRRVLPDGIMLDLDYEHLVTDFPAQVARLLSFCGLDWDDNCLNFHRSARPVLTASAGQVRLPIYRDSLRRPRPPDEILKQLTDELFG